MDHSLSFLFFYCSPFPVARLYSLPRAPPHLSSTISPLALLPHTSPQQKFWIVDGETVSVATGNWSPSDYPGTPDSYPPFSSGAAWRSINRDFTISYKAANVASVFQTVIDKDCANSTTWKPSTSLHRAMPVDLM